MNVRFPTNVVVVTDVSGIGGSERRLLTFAERFDPRFLLHFCTLGPSGPLIERLKSLGHATHALDVRKGTDNALALARLVALFRRIRPAIVHGQIRYSAFLAALAGRIARVPVVLATRTYTHASGRNAFLDRATTRMVDATIAVSESAAGVVLRDEGARPERVIVIPNGVELEKLSPLASRRRWAADPGRRIILSVGNLHRVKGHEWIIRALPRIRAKIPGARLIVVGEGHLRSPLERLALELGMRDAVELAGFHEDVVPFLAAADIFVLPSEDEGMSRALIEAMGAGLPVVATDVGGNREVVRAGETGLLVPAKDPVALAEAAVSLLDDQMLALRLGAAALARARTHFSAETMIARYVELYERLLA